jgi:carbonic anhydrase
MRFLDHHILRATSWRAPCKSNIIEQARNVARTTLVGAAWRRGQSLMLHGWIYGLIKR